MFLSHATVLPLLLSLSAAQNFSTWSPPGPADVRSPCPGLNSLANHGFLPHNGKGVTIPILIKALNDGMNIGADFATVIGGAGLLSVPANLLATSFDLNDLNEHNFPIEHDASLSRADYYGNNEDNYSFKETIFDTVLAYYDGMNETSIPVAAKAKYNRVATEERKDPKFTYTPQQFILSYGETALYISVMGDPIYGVASVEYVRIFFEQERLPYAEGWRPPPTQTTLLTLCDMILVLWHPLPEHLAEYFPSSHSCQRLSLLLPVHLLERIL
ncbi:Cloroperoxidase [Stipitochalara longipes BDJ]|nr:Cloroperoxidase [Stipitochalara longipes BDJ]